MIEKFKKPDNKKAVFYKLTDKGKKAYYSHKDFHKGLNDKVMQYISSLSKEQFEGLLGLLDVIEKNLPNSKSNYSQKEVK